MTTVVCVQHNGKTIMGGDGQVTSGNFIPRNSFEKVRKITILGKPYLFGIAGEVSGAYALLTDIVRFLEQNKGTLLNVLNEFVSNNINNQFRKQYNASVMVADSEEIIIVEHGLLLSTTDSKQGKYSTMGSGQPYSISSLDTIFKLLQDGKMKSETLSAEEIALQALKCATERDTGTNGEYTFVEL